MSLEKRTMLCCLFNTKNFSLLEKYITYVKYWFCINVVFPVKMAIFLLGMNFALEKV